MQQLQFTWFSINLKILYLTSVFFFFEKKKIVNTKGVSIIYLKSGVGEFEGGCNFFL